MTEQAVCACDEGFVVRGEWPLGIWLECPACGRKAGEKRE